MLIRFQVGYGVLPSLHSLKRLMWSTPLRTFLAQRDATDLYLMIDNRCDRQLSDMKELLAQSWKRALGSENVQNCEANEMTSVIVGLARLYNPWRKEAVLRLNNGETPLSHSLTMYLTIPMPSSSRPTRGGPPFEPVPEGQYNIVNYPTIAIEFLVTSVFDIARNL